MTDPVYITALRDDDTAIAPEAEGVLIDAGSDAIRLTLDDGHSLTFDAQELRAALGEAA